MEIKSAFAAAAHVLSYSTLNAERFINHDTRRIDWDGLYDYGMNGRYSDGEQTIVECALALWNGSGNELTKLGHVMNRVSAEPYRLIMEAVLALRPIVYDVRNDVSPMDDFRWVRLSRWQVETATSAAKHFESFAETTGDPQSWLEVAAELKAIDEAWKEGQK